VGLWRIAHRVVLTGQPKGSLELIGSPRLPFRCNIKPGRCSDVTILGPHTIVEWFVLATRMDLDGTNQTVQAVHEDRVSDTFLQESGTSLSELFEEKLDLESRRWLYETVLSHWLL
jgi:hypothetical protein